MQLVDAPWSKPVITRLHNGLTHTFHTAGEALDFLENEWPVRYGVHHRRALDLCQAARNRMVSREAAREAFIGACLEANMPLVVTAGPPAHEIPSQTARPPVMAT